MYPHFEEHSLAAIGCNRARDHWDRVRLVSMYKDGVHTGAWQSCTVAEAAEEQHKLATAFRLLGIAPQDRVAIMAPNRPEWAFAFGSLLMIDAVVVTIYPTLLGPDAAYILRDSGAKCVLVDSAAKADLVRAEWDTLPELQTIVVMEPEAPREGTRVLRYADLLETAAGRVDLEALYDGIRRIGRDSVAAIIYTSGTTGRPKGVMLTHGNFMCQQIVLDKFDLSPDDVFLNHLPFCHVFGLTSDLLGSQAIGAQLVISDGMEPEKIRHALQTIRPTVLMSVPRLFEKVFIQVHQVVESRPPFVKRLFEGALHTGKRVFDLAHDGKPIPRALALRHRFARRIAKKVLARAGLERVRLAYAGGAPTSRELCHFFQGLGINLYQGYGLTETSPIATVNLPEKNKLGTVGPPLPGVEIKIAEDGEILIRGANIMRGYYKNPEATAEAIDAEGWFHSGDIGEIDTDGYLKIVDRKKELIVTSGGKNIAPLPIESAFNTDPYIERAVVIGDHRNYLTALVCPEFATVRAWAEREGLGTLDDAALAAHPRVKQLLDERVALVNEGLARFEQIKKIAVMDHPFTPIGGEITPTEKLKRRVIRERYADIIEALYR